MPRPLDYDPAEPTAVMRAIPIHDSGEPLVDFLAAPYHLTFDRPRFRYRRHPWARQGLAERLASADLRLRADGSGLLILECWRSPMIQRRMFRAVEAQMRDIHPDLSFDELRTLVEKYSAPDDPHVPPPHTTGGAVDLWLANSDGSPADLHSPFDFKDPASFAFDCEGLSQMARENRDRLAAALDAEGITNYASEYWHFSFGDQGWAYRSSQVTAHYNSVTPEGWEPNEDDESDHPLEFEES